MSQITSKGQFVEIDFTGFVKQTGEIFDTTVKENAKKANLPSERLKPLVICVGEGMVLNSFDKSLEQKELGKEYSIDLKPKEAFGERDPKLVKIVPLNFFHKKGINPYPGLSLNMDGIIVRISAVSGGRVITDFNNPLSGKEITYKFKISITIMLSCFTTVSIA